MRRLCYLPDEVVEEILLRLPPKSLMRFKCVCKSWNTLISDPSFADKHLHISNNHHSSSTPLLLTLKRNRNYGNGYLQQRYLVSFSSDDDDVKDDTDHLPCGIEYLDLSVILGVDNANVLRGSHCNGVLSLSELLNSSEKRVFLYNPSTREFRVLPTCAINAFFIGVEGFGYDSKANDYKFVRMFHSAEINDYIAMVYSMGSDSWRQIKVGVEGLVYVSNNVRVLYRGVYYWWVPNLSDSSEVLLSFDMSSEEFDIIRLPDSVQKQLIGPKILSVWNESLLIFSVTSKMGSISFDIWAMTDCPGGVKGLSWTKLLTVGPLVGISFPMAFWKNDELLMHTEDGRIASYNLGSQKLRKFPFRAVLPIGCFVDLFVKSLVSVKRRN